jgi:hypothetical protein
MAPQSNTYAARANASTARRIGLTKLIHQQVRRVSDSSQVVHPVVATTRAGGNPLLSQDHAMLYSAACEEGKKKEGGQDFLPAFGCAR